MISAFNLKYPFSSGINAKLFHIASQYPRAIYMSENAIYITYRINFKTIIHKIDIQEIYINPSANTQISGKIHDRFSMD